ncbi:MAG: response regulator [Deltaproteobacteria bacterium]|jgi:CheY-like chemotaxis protein|nr:response regulator [Deltaproteobacteria bacterium]
MSETTRPRILIIDDEEAILETLTFTFMDLYEVLSTADPKEALSILEENRPVAVVITDQRMPGMTGVELLKQVYDRFPETVRIILTGFADSEATIQAINAGHIYGYINKPWEPEELKTMVRHAAELHALTMENRRLVEDLREANLFLEGVMDRLRTGAIAVDREGIVRAVNEPARAFVGLEGDIRGRAIGEVLGQRGLEELGETVRTLAEESGGSFEEVDLRVGAGHRIRVSSKALTDDRGEAQGRVVLFKEISHEPLTRDFEQIAAGLASEEGPLRASLERALDALEDLAGRVVEARVESANMSELGERISRLRTAITSWLDVDDALASEDYPDAQRLLDRMRVASQRWPRGEALPRRVQDLARAVEAYYESGENARERVL